MLLLAAATDGAGLLAPVRARGLVQGRPAPALRRHVEHELERPAAPGGAAAARDAPILGVRRPRRRRRAADARRVGGRRHPPRDHTDEGARRLGVHGRRDAGHVGGLRAGVRASPAPGAAVNLCEPMACNFTNDRARAHFKPPGLPSARHASAAASSWRRLRLTASPTAARRPSRCRARACAATPRSRR